MYWLSLKKANFESTVTICGRRERDRTTREIKNEIEYMRNDANVAENDKIQEEKRIFEEDGEGKKMRTNAIERKARISTKRIPLSDFIPPVTPNVKTVNSLRIGDKHLDTQKGSIESSVKDPISIPSESDVISDGDCDDDYQKRFDLKVQQLWMPSIYDENNKIRECYIIRPSAITPDLPIPDSLIMEDEHLDTIPDLTDSAKTQSS
ncbi:hypothetical protein Tco_0183466 [Tanacetum coccineum]